MLLLLINMEIKRILGLALFIVMAVIAVLLIIFFTAKFGNYDLINYNITNNTGDLSDTGFCTSDIDCVPASCCHANSCTSANYAPKCDRIFCTLECAPGSLDCGQGSCACVNNKCIGVMG